MIQKSFDELLDGLLTDWRNQFPEADTSQGSLIFFKSACLASALWGIYRYQDWIAQQIFPDTADSANLEHHAWIRGVTRRVGETDSELLARLLDWIRRPPAGGNKGDYVKWALEVANVARAWCFPVPQGPGSVDVVLTAAASTGSEIPNQALLDAVTAHIDAVRPVGAQTMRILPPVIVTQDVTMSVTGSVTPEAVEAQVSALLSDLEPGATLYRSQLFAAAIRAGATNAVITVPAADVPASIAGGAYEMFRPGTITIS
jgi:uncharacterized phage protein gp47/JayE